jgi:hypothetical protein
MKPAFYLLILMTLLFSGCKKEKPIVFSGQLLLTSKFPYPLVNRKIEIYQPGSPSAIGINSGSRSSSATTRTDANGNFRLSFTPGTASFLIFSGTNSNSLSLANSSDETAFPRFSRKNFPDSAYDAAKPIFVGKTIDTAIIKVDLSSDLTATDTIGLRAYTISGSIDKEYIGRSGTMGATIVLDTIYNLLLTDFDCFAKKFINTVYAGRKWTTTSGYVTISSYGFISPYQFSAIDEAKQEIKFYFKK